MTNEKNGPTGESSVTNQRMHYAASAAHKRVSCTCRRRGGGGGSARALLAGRMRDQM